MELSASILKRLAMIRYLHGVGIAQSRQSEPLCAISILTFHDAVEWFLQLAADSLNANINDQQKFHDYWALLAKLDSPVLLTGKGNMLRLNKARVALKHYGIEPNRDSIEAFRVHVADFLEENTSIVFGVSFNSINLAVLVANQSAHALLDEAATHSANEDHVAALDKLAMAFHILIDDFERVSESPFLYSPFRFGRGVNSTIGTNASLGRDLGLEFESLVDSVSRMELALSVLSLGLDYRNYAKFKYYTPTVFKNGMSQRSIFRDAYAKDRTQYEVDFCFNFVIECALKLQEISFSELAPRTDY